MSLIQRILTGVTPAKSAAERAWAKATLGCLALFIVLCGAPPASAQVGPNVASLTLSATSVRAGQSVTATVGIASAAPAGGATVLLDDADSPLVTLPPSVVVPAGATSASFTITTAQTIESDAARIMAYGEGGSAQIVYLTVTPPTHVAPEYKKAWATYYDGPLGLRDGEYPVYVDVDASGNVYVAGTSLMDPANWRGDKDISIVKYDAQGNQLWAQRWAGAAGYIDITRAMKIDADGNVYVAGSTWKRLSFDGGTEYDYVTLKYDTFGNLLWASYYDGPIHLNDDPTALELDAQGNVYVTGWSWNGEVGVRIAAGFATVKYDRDGNQLWVRRFDNYNNNGAGANALAVDSTGSVYVAGHVMRTDGVSYDLYTIKYDTNGNQVWADQLNTPEESVQQEQTFFLRLGPQNEVYLAGCSWRLVNERLDYLLVKYSADGRHLWTRSWGTDLDEKPYGMDLDKAGNVFVSGTSDARHPNFNDTITAKFDPAGNMLWRRRFNGSMNEWDHNRGVVVDADGNAFVLVAEQEQPGLIQYTVVKYAPNGTELWTHSTPGTGGASAYPTSMKMDASGNIYIVGEGPRLAGSSNNDFYTVKLTRGGGTTTPPPPAPAPSLSISGAVLNGSAGLAAVEVRLTSTTAGFTPLTATTSATGAYSFANVPAGRSYVITPVSAVYNFSPASRSVASPAAPVMGQNFSVLSRKSYAVTGRVLLGTAGLNGVVVQLRNSAGSVIKTATTVTSAAGVAGSYSFAGVPAGSDYKVTMGASAVYSYMPASRSYTSLSANQASQNFTAARKTYFINGRVVKAGTTTGVGGVTMTLINSGTNSLVKSVTTLSDGSYSLAGVPAGYSYTLRPSKSGLAFTPASRSYTNLIANQGAQNFSGQ